MVHTCPINEWKAPLDRSNSNLCKLQFVHSLFSEPVKKCSPPVHDPKLKVESFKQFLYSCVVSDESGRHFHSVRWHVANRDFSVMRDPLDKMSAFLILNVRHLILDFLHRQFLTAKHGGVSEVSAIPWIAGNHNVFGVEYLVSQLWYC